MLIKKMSALFLSMTLSASLVSASVVGQLSRMPVNNSTSPAFRVFGQIEDFCSGTLISPRLVLTAAHCVYDQNNSTWLPVTKFSPAKNGNINPYGSIEVLKIHAPSSYISGDDRQDLAVLVLAEPIGLQTGWLEIGWDLAGFSNHQSPLGGFISTGTISGYPGDKELGTMWVAACNFYVPTIYPLLPQYNCDTFGGMSGSSLVISSANGKSIIVGVHTKGHGSFNSGVLLTGDNKDFLQEVMRLHPL